MKALHIEHVEHLTVQIGDRPANPFTSILSKALAGGLASAAVANFPGAGPTAAATPAAATVQTSAPTLQAPAIGQAWQGGIYAGVSRGEDGEPDGHVILLEAKPEKLLSWADAGQWATDLGDGARLPTRMESALLYANLKDQFEEDRYHWTGTQYSDSLAWIQRFGHGTQITSNKSYEARARAVRRFAL